MKAYYLGNNVGALIGLHWSDGYYGTSDSSLNGFIKQLKNQPYKYLVAVTADKFQQKARKVLAENKFKSVVTFYSAHNDKSEKLTMWVKAQKGKKNIIGKAPKFNAGGNCSVSYGKEVGGKRFCIVAAKNRKEKNLYNYEKVDKMPIYWRVDNGDNLIGGFFD